MCSIHANSAREALSKLSTLPLLAGRNIDSSFVVPTVAASIDIVVHCALERSGRRHIAQIVAPTGRVTGGVIEADTIFELRGGSLDPTGSHPARLSKFRSAGLDPGLILAPVTAPTVAPAVAVKRGGAEGVA